MQRTRSEPLIRTTGLHHIYREGTSYALDGIDLEIEAGEYIAVVGANGSGKSTLLMHLNALLLPTSGDVMIAGMNTKNNQWLREIRSMVGMVFQSPDTQIIATIVEEDVAFGPENIGVPEQELRHRVVQALRAVGLYKLRKRPSHLLSAGQKQLLAIASALAMHPRCLVLDEATSMLDPASRRSFLETLAHLHRQGMTIVCSTHNMDEAALAQRIIVLSKGKVIADGNPNAIFSRRELLVSANIEPPSSLRLAEKIGEYLYGFYSSALTITGLADEVDAYLRNKGSYDQ